MVWTANEQNLLCFFLSLLTLLYAELLNPINVIQNLEKLVCKGGIAFCCCVRATKTL